MPTPAIPASPVPTPATRPGCPSWCAHPHYDDEPHYGPFATVSALARNGEPLLVSLEQDLAEAGMIELTVQTPVWLLPSATSELTFTPEQAAELRDVLNTFLAAADRPATRPEPESPDRDAVTPDLRGDGDGPPDEAATVRKAVRPFPRSSSFTPPTA